MNLETALWIIGALVPVALAWSAWVTHTLKEITRTNEELVDMHKAPDQYGFGTGKTNVLISDFHTSLVNNTRAIKGLTHYIRWLAEQQTGKKSPPPIEES